MLPVLPSAPSVAGVIAATLLAVFPGFAHDELVASSVPGVRVFPGFDVQVFNTGGLPIEMALESTGNILVSSNTATAGIRRLSPVGGLLATSAAFADPDGVTIDSLGRILATNGTRIMGVGSLSGGSNSVFATGFANLNWVVSDALGFIYAVENDGRIRKVSSSGSILGTLATLPAWPAISVGPDGALYATRSGRLVRIDSTTGVIQDQNSSEFLNGHVAFAPGNEFGTDRYVTNFATGNLYRVDAQGDLCLFASGLSRSLALLFDSNGDLLVSDYIVTNRILRIFSTGGSVPPPTAGCTNEPSDAISWWMGDGSASDFHGVSHGTMSNGATFATGKVGQGFNLDGFNDYVRIPQAGTAYNFTASESFSFEGWFKTSSGGTNRQIVAKNEGFFTGSYNIVLLANGTLQAGVAPDQGAVYHVISAGHYNDGDFHHFACIVDRATDVLTLIVDGCAEFVSIAFPAAATFLNSTDLLIGARNPVTPNSFFQGVIDEVAIYRRALGAAEVAAIYDAGSFGKCKDVDSPMVTILMPENGDVIGDVSADVTAQISDASSTAVSSTPPGVSASLPAGGGIATGTVPLVEGSNSIVVSAVDGSNNVGGTSITVIRDTTAPSVTIVSPLEGAIFGDSPVTVTVAVGDATVTNVSFGTNTFALPAGGGTATGNVDLVEGANTIVVSAIDAAGNPASAEVHVVLDLTAPLVTIDSPTDGACFGPGDSPIAVIATVDDLTATAVESTPAGVSAALPAGGGMASGAIALAEGHNTIQIRATDATTRIGSASISVLLDTTPPQVSIDSPIPGAAVRGTIDFDASAMDVAPGTGIARVDFLVDSNLLASVTAAPFETTLDTTALVDGAHVLEVLAVDGKSNSTGASLTILVDNTPPMLAIASPSSGALVSNTAPFEVDGADTGSGLASIEMLAGGVAPTADASVVYATPVAFDTRFGSEDTSRWPDGALAFSARVRDAAGNETFASVTVEVDNTAPAKSLISPTDGSFVSGVIAIVADAQDPNLDTLEILVDGMSLGTSAFMPFSASFDTRARLDGVMTITIVARDLAGNTGTCTATVTVDNVTVRIDPRTLNLKSKGKENSVTVCLEGSSLALLLPTESHAIVLRVPGGNPVPATAGFAGDDALADSDGDGIPDLTLKFDRQQLIASIQAGMAANLIQPDSNVALTIVAEGGFAIGSDVIRVNSR